MSKPVFTLEQLDQSLLAVRQVLDFADAVVKALRSDDPSAARTQVAEKLDEHLRVLAGVQVDLQRHLAAPPPQQPKVDPSIN